MSLGNFQNGCSSFPQVWQPMMISNFLQLLPLGFTQLKFQWWGHGSPPDYNKTASPDSLRYLIFKVHKPLLQLLLQYRIVQQNHGDIHERGHEGHSIGISPQNA
jgi:hypothetical protein